MRNSPAISSFTDQLGAASERQSLSHELSGVLAAGRSAALLVVHMPAGMGASPQDLMRRLRPFVRANDVLGALEDGSPAVLLRDVGDRANAVGAAQRLFQRCELLQLLGRPHTDAFVSFGIVMLPSSVADAPTVLAKARRAARYAFRTRARWVCWSDGPDDTDGALLSREDTLATQVIHGLDRGEFELYYQPQLQMSDSRVRGMEALIRWNRNGEVVLPGTFIPAVESAGLSAALGSWVLDTACRQLARWRRGGVPCPRIAINMSAAQLRSDLVDSVWHTLADHGVDPSWLEIELTESSEIADPDEALRLTRQLAEMGIGFSLDDFGTGYSSFLRLKAAPFNAVKIERQFVSGMLSNRYDRQILESMIGFSRGVSIETIAEGVETVEQLDYLRAIGCDAWQGYLCSPPVPEADAARLLLGRLRA